MSTRDDHGADDRADNTVFLRGRLAAEPMARTLPSGDELCSFRLTVTRPLDAGTRTRVDSIDCATTAARARRCLDRAAPGDVLEVTGALHRRFWRSSGGLGSRYEVQVTTARVNRRRKSDA
ncbi:MAG TPA: single-stranded DNA-binding protein [Jatrophihabitans sp.]